MPNPVDMRTDQFVLLWAQEDSWGAAVTPNRRFGLHDQATLPDPDVNRRSFYGVGTDRNRQLSLEGPWDLRGSIPDIELQTDTWGQVSALPIGFFNNGTVNEGISLALQNFDSRINSFTMLAAVKQTDGSYPFVRRYRGCKVNRASWACREGDSLRLNLEEIIAADIEHNLNGTDRGSLPRAAYTGGDPGISSDSRFMWNNGSLSVGLIGQPLTGLCALRDVTYSVDNQLNPRHYICLSGNIDGGNSQVINDLQEGKRIYTCQVGIDLINQNTDLVLFQYLMTHNTFGFTVVSVFNPVQGESDSDFSILTIYGSLFATSTNEGSYVISGKANMPPPPAGIIPADYTIGLSSLFFNGPAQ